MPTQEYRHESLPFKGLGSRYLFSVRGGYASCYGPPMICAESLATTSGSLSQDSPLPARVREMLAGRGVVQGPSGEELGSACGERLDTELMALFRDTRDGEVFECLYLRARCSVLDWLRRLGARDQPRTDAAELLQDTFVNVYRYSRRFRNENGSSFRVWVRTIAANVRKRARKEALRAPAAEPVDQRPGPLHCYLLEEERRAFVLSWLLFLEHYARAYDSLGPRDREALVLVELEGLSYAEAARRLRVGSSNMKMIMFRSRQRILRHMLRAMGESTREIRAAG